MVMVQKDFCERDVDKVDPTLFEAKFLRDPVDLLMGVVCPGIVGKSVALCEVVMAMQLV
jgi:hypothetical protein